MFTFLLDTFGGALQRGAQTHFGLPRFMMQRFPGPQVVVSQVSKGKWDLLSVRFEVIGSYYPCKVHRRLDH